MKRLWRIIFNALTVLSLLLCVATGALWVRSYWRSERIEWTRGSGEDVPPDDQGLHRVWFLARYAVMERGRASLGSSYDEVSRVYSGSMGYGDGLTLGERALGLPTPGSFFVSIPREWHVLGFALVLPSNKIVRDASNEQMPATGRVYGLTIPTFVLVIAFVILPSFWVYKALRRRDRSRSGRCPSCRYDLTGNISGVCPECGVKVAACEVRSVARSRD